MYVPVQFTPVTSGVPTIEPVPSRSEKSTPMTGLSSADIEYRPTLRMTILDSL